MRSTLLLPAALLLWATAMGCSDGIHVDVVVAGAVEGTGGVDPTGAPDSGAFPISFPNANADSSIIYDQTALRTYELRLSEANLERIDNDPSAEEYVEGSLVFDGSEYGPVGIRYKGSIGAFLSCTEGGGFTPGGRKICDKLSMKVKFNWLVPEGRFYGMKRIQFHSMNNDPTLLRERLAYSLFNDMGVFAPRAVHARLRINGEEAGLFALVEQVDGRFTRRNFPDGGEGNLYKEIWPVHDDPALYRMALKTNEDESPSFDKVLSFQAELAAASDEQILDVVDRWMDRRHMARYIAVDRAIENDDGIFHWYCPPAGSVANRFPVSFLGSDCFNHNYFWYEATDSDRMWLIPWDLDITWQDGAGITAINREWNDTSTTCSSIGGGFLGQMDPQCDRLTHAWAMMEADYRVAVADLLQGPLSRESVDAKLDAWTAQIRPVVEAGLVLDNRRLTTAQWEEVVARWRLHVDEMRDEAATWR